MNLSEAFQNTETNLEEKRFDVVTRYDNGIDGVGFFLYKNIVSIYFFDEQKVAEDKDFGIKTRDNFIHWEPSADDFLYNDWHIVKNVTIKNIG